MRTRSDAIGSSARSRCQARGSRSSVTPHDEAGRGCRASSGVPADAPSARSRWHRLAARLYAARDGDRRRRADRRGAALTVTTRESPGASSWRSRRELCDEAPTIPHVESALVGLHPSPVHRLVVVARQEPVSTHHAVGIQDQDEVVRPLLVHLRGGSNGALDEGTVARLKRRALQGLPRCADTLS